MAASRDPLFANDDARTLALRTERALQAVQRAASTCAACGGRTCGHGALGGLVLGIAGQDLCLDCLAALEERDAAALRAELSVYIAGRACLAQGWTLASAAEWQTEEGRQACVWHPHHGALPVAQAAGAAAETLPRPAPRVVFDAGDQGCGELMLALRIRFQALAPFTIMELRALDPGAREDIPAWCRLTGHRLLSAHHPHYEIERKA